MMTDHMTHALPDPDRHAEFYAGTAFKRGVAWIVDTIFVTLLVSLVALVTPAVPSARKVTRALAGICIAPQTLEAMPQPTSRRPSRMERGSALRFFQPNFSAPRR